MNTARRKSHEVAVLLSIALVAMTGQAWATITAVSESARLSPSDCGWCDNFGQNFGRAVALDGNLAIIGASHNDAVSTRNQGAVWVYEKNPDGQWATAGKLIASDAGPEGFFGFSVALQDGVAVIGAPNHTLERQFQGAVYVLERGAGGEWVEVQRLTASDPNMQQMFGVDVDIDGDTIVIGARNLTLWTGAGYGTGAVYVFVRDASGTWVQQAKLTGSDVVRTDYYDFRSSYFGLSVDIDGDAVIAGHIYGKQGDIESGAAYVFVREAGGTWLEEAKITALPSTDDGGMDMFGRSVAIDGQTAAVGAYGYGPSLQGAAYVFEKGAEGSWNQVAFLRKQGEFGDSVAIEGNRLIVSAPGFGNGTSQGTVHLYSRDSVGDWIQQSVLGYAAPNSGGMWGGLGTTQWGAAAIAVSGSRVLAGAPGYNSPWGAAFIFEEDDRPPVVSGLVINPNPLAVGQSFTVQAVLDDSQTGNSAIASAYYTVEGGARVVMSATDGHLDAPVEEIAAVNSDGMSVGAYRICVGGTDTAGNGAQEECTFVAVYDPNAGYVTGGGWINSAAGTCRYDADCVDAAGRANFGFVSRYDKGAAIPTGNTEFQFSAGGLNFHAETYEWLVVNMSGTSAQYKGSGTVNGKMCPAGDAYKFMLWARDFGNIDADTFRIKIWCLEAGSEVLVYDNGFQQAIGGGSIVVHVK